MSFEVIFPRQVMQVIAIQRVQTPPNGVVEYPDFLLCLLLESGVGKLEPDWKSSDGKQVDWIFTSRTSGEQKTVASCPMHWLRPIFARFAFMVGINPYCGQAFFKVKGEEAEETSKESFCLFLCNEPTMEIWMKLYSYGIEKALPLGLEERLV